MRTNKILLCLILFLSFTGLGIAQTITGEVIDKSTKETVPGANIIIVGQKGIGATTDDNGKFSVDIPGGQGQIIVSFVGFQDKTINITPEKTFYKIELDLESTVLGTAVVVGFGTQKKENLTGAITAINVEDLKGSSVQNLDKNLQGRVPGLSVTYRNGDLSSAPQIQVRGTGSLNATNGGAPLIIVDNVEVSDLRTVNSEDIESMTLLKDAASTSIYGTRAAFGVLLVTTKTGRKNQPTKISYSNNFGWNTPTKLADFPSDPIKDLQGGILANARNGNNNPELFGMQFPTLIAGIQRWQENYANNRTSNEMVLGEDWEIIGGQPYFYRIWDVKDIMFKKWTSQQTHNLQVSGGSEKIAYYTSLGYNETNGFWKPATDRMRRISATASISASVTDWLDLNVKYQSNFSKHEQPFQYQDYFYYMWRWGAYMPYGTYKGTHFRTPNGFMSNAGEFTKEQNVQRINASLIAKITDDIKLNVDYVYSVDHGTYRNPGASLYLWNNWTTMNANTEPVNLTQSSDYIQYTSLKETKHTFNVYGTWEKTLKDDHNFKLTAGVNTETGGYLDHLSQRHTLLNPDYPELSLAVGQQYAKINNPDKARYDWAVAGFFARINYDYKGIWLLEVNGRYDGSSNFPGNDQWAFFPSASVGYRISQEQFMEPVKNIVNDLKIRASYGTIGNQDVGRNKFRKIMNRDELANGNPQNDVNWIEGSTKLPYIGSPQAISETLSWERVNTLDIGVDARFLNMFTLTFDWFQRDTKDMIALGKTLPSTFGAKEPYTNAGDLRTRGWEIELGFNKTFGNGLTVHAAATLSDYKTTITKWNNPIKDITGRYEGKVLGDIWGFETDRYFTANDNMSQLPNQSGLASTANFIYGPGDIKYKDLDGSGIIDGGKGTLDDHGDLKIIGNSMPRYQYGLRAGFDWKGFDFEVYFQGVGKRKMWGYGDMAIPYYRGADLLLDHQLDYWTEDNPNAKYPRLFTNSQGGKVNGLTPAHGSNNFYPQSKYLLNMAYLRLKNLTVGYTLPQELTQKFYIQKLRVYFNAQNLFEISDVGIPIDPETDFNTANPSTTDFLGRSYPYARTLSFGVQLTF